MEAKLNQNVQKMIGQVGASSVVVADKNGMQILSKGNLDPRVAATSAQIMSDAKNMNATAGKYENPIVVLHGAGNSKLTIVNNHGETVTIHTK